MKTPLPRLAAALCVTAALLLSACESRPDRHAMMEEARRAVPPMAANDSFFNGAIVAHLTLGNELGSEGAPGSPSGEPGSGGGGGRHGHGGGGMGPGGGHRGGGGPSGGGEGAPTASMRASNMPPATLHLRLENTTAAAVEVEVRDLDSDLGDFAVRPDKLTIEPNQSGSFEPMQSLLGLETYALPVTVTLRWAGKTETRILTLQLVKPASEPALQPGK